MCKFVQNRIVVAVAIQNLDVYLLSWSFSTESVESSYFHMRQFAQWMLGFQLHAPSFSLRVITLLSVPAAQT